MGKQGRPTAQGIRDFVIQTKRNAPALSHVQIADRVEANFGKEARIDKTTVGHILTRAGLGRGSTGAPSAPQGLDRQEAAAHRGALLPTLLELQGIGPFPFHDYDLAIWHPQADVPCWPIPKGQVCRDSNGRLTVRLDAASKLEWTYLRQHLPNDPVWSAVRDSQEAMAADMTARLVLLQEVKDRILRPAADGGLGLPVSDEMGRGGIGQLAAAGWGGPSPGAFQELVDVAGTDPQGGGNLALRVASQRHPLDLLPLALGGGPLPPPGAGRRRGLPRLCARLHLNGRVAEA